MNSNTISGVETNFKEEENEQLCLLFVEKEEEREKERNERR